MPRRAFAELYAAHAAFVWRASVYLGVPAAQLDDAVQEVFLVAHRRLAGFEARSSIRTWLFGIARRVAFRIRRTQSRAQRRADAIAALPPDARDLEDWYAHREAGDRVLRFIAELEPDQRMAFVLSDVEGLTRRELGEALSINENTAWARVRAARAKLAHTFGDTTALESLLTGALEALGPTQRRKSAIWIALLPKLPLAVAGTVAPWAAGIVVAIGFVGGTVIATRSASEPDVEVAPASSGVPVLAPARDEVGPASARASPPARAVDPQGLPAALPTAAYARRERALGPSAADGGARSEATADAGAPADAGAGPTAEVGIERELAAIVAARGALERRDPAAALRELDPLRTAVPRGAHGEERDALRIVALCGLGRASEARAESASFTRAHPRSLLRPRIEGACRSTDSAAGGD